MTGTADDVRESRLQGVALTRLMLQHDEDGAAAVLLLTDDRAGLAHAAVGLLAALLHLSGTAQPDDLTEATAEVLGAARAGDRERVAQLLADVDCVEVACDAAASAAVVLRDALPEDLRTQVLEAFTAAAVGPDGARP